MLEGSKINTNGSKSSNGTSGGGIIRDHKGDFIGGFTHQYYHAMILHAKLQAIYDGLLMCQQMSIEDYILEMDYVQASYMVRKETVEYRSCTYLLRCIWMLNLNLHSIRLIYREENRAADPLAKEAYYFSTWQDFYNCQDLSLSTRKCIFQIELDCLLFGLIVIRGAFFLVGQHDF